MQVREDAAVRLDDVFRDLKQETRSIDRIDRRASTLLSLRKSNATHGRHLWVVVQIAVDRLSAARSDTPSELLGEDKAREVEALRHLKEEREHCWKQLLQSGRPKLGRG